MSHDDLAWPPWSGPAVLESALATLSDATSPSRDYFAVLDAVGNNHRGTYFPCVVLAIPGLGSLLRGSAPTPRLRALDVLLDVLGSFAPEPEHAHVSTDDGPRALEHLLLDAARRLLPDLECLVESAASEAERALAEAVVAELRPR